MSSTEWKDIAYDGTFETTMRSLVRRRVDDATFTAEAARGVLKHLYIQDGNDWAGRGGLQDIVTQATIDAYEQFITEWETSDRQDQDRSALTS